MKPAPDKALPPQAGFICRECAKKHGGKWPRGHCATCHRETCPVCGKTKTLANVGDWNWPDGKSRGMRD